MTTMIKGIIEKIIMTTFGKFVKGIQKEKLSVDLLGGNFKLENISLNHEYFDGLNSPFKLAYSSIGKLNLQAPLSKLSSVPVECVLDSIYVIFQFKETGSKQKETLAARKEKILKELGDVLESALKKAKQQKKQDGMMARLGKKIIDNLQLKIMNVHLRFEQQSQSSSYAWGLTLQQISFTTTDNKWKPCFFERAGLQKEKLFKMMQVKKLNFYWESGTLNKNIILKRKQVTDQQRKNSLAAMIKQEHSVVLSITSEFKLIINPLQDINSPVYQLEVKLQPIKFELQRLQFIQINDFFRKNVMQNQLIVKSIGKRNKINEEEKGLFRQQYEQFISQALIGFQKNQKIENLQGYDEQLATIFDRIDDGQLKIWSLGPVKKRVKAVKQQQILKKKSGWFSKGQSQLSQQQEEQLQKYIESTFEGEKSSRDSKYLLFRINAELKGGKMILIHKIQDLEENIEFNVGKISTSISKSQDQSQFESYLQIASINLSLFLPILKGSQLKHRKMEIFTSERPNQYKQNSDEEDSMESFDSAQEQQPPLFLKLAYRNQLLNEKTVLKKSISGRMERVTVIYKRLFMDKIQKFFSFKKTGGNFSKNHNIQKFENFDSVKQQGEQTETDSFKLQKILDVKLDINSPVIICPLNQKQCWCLNLGCLNIISNRNQQFQEFPMKVTSAFLRYYPHMKECFDLRKSQVRKGIFSLINDMDFTVNYQRMKKIRQDILSIELPSFKVNFTRKQYENLMSLAKVFKVEESQKRDMVQQQKQQRKAVEDGKTYEGSIFKKHETLMSWNEFYGIISGQYLYLYEDRKFLRESSKIYLKNAKIMIKESIAEEDNPQLQLINLHQICYLGCRTLPELQNWKLQLDKKCRQFKTINELIKQYQQREGESGKKRTGSQITSMSEEMSKRKILKFKVKEVQFRYQSQDQDCLLEFQINQIDFSRENMLEWSEKIFTMRTLKITDRIFKFKNTTYQTLLQAKGVHFQELKGRKKNEGIRKTIINLDLDDIYINWKPDVLLILMRLLDQHFKSEVKHRFDDDIQQSRQQHFKQVHADTKYMFMRQNYSKKGNGFKVKDKRDQLSLKSKWMKDRMKTNVVVKKIQINLIHRETHLVMFKVLSNLITCELAICETAKFVKGTVLTLDLFDMTGYPRKDYSPNQDYPPYRLLTKNGESEIPLIQYRWSSYDQNSFPNQQRIDSFIWVQISPLQYQYYQQITFRMVDYLLIQVILLINQPQMLTVNEGLLQQLKKHEAGWAQQSKNQKPVKILFSQYEQIIKKLIDPFFIDMFFKLNNPTIVLKAEKNSHIYYKTTMAELTFFNRTLKKSIRFQKQKCEQVKQLIYQDQYVVEGKDCHFIQISERKNRSQQLFEPFKIQVILNKLIFEDQINLLYPQIQNYDRSFLTINKISNIIISHYSRLQYLNINKLVNFNFMFDDQNDQLFIHNFKVTKLLSPKPIVYDVVIPQIHMTADYNARQNTEDIWKLFKATIHQFSMTYRRNKKLDSSIVIGLHKTQITGFQYEQSQKQPIQYDLLTLGGQELGRNSTQVLIQNKTTGQKLIQMNVNQMKVNVRTGLLQLIFQYSLIEDWVFPSVNKFVPEMSFYATVHQMNAELSEDSRLIIAELSKKKGSLKVIRELMSGITKLAAFRLEGLMVYKFHRAKNLTIQQYCQKLQKKQMSYDDFQKLPATASMNLIINTEIYRTWVDSPSKRKIIQKFTYTMEDKRYLRVADQKLATIKTIAKRIMNIDRGFLKLSFKDIILMKTILAQMGEERKYISYLNEKTGKTQIINNELLSKQTESSSLQNLELKVQIVSFYLINSRRDVFIPILKLNLGCINFSKANTFKKDILKGDFSISIYYFNNTIFRWQPMLQRVQLAFHKLTYYQQNNQIFGSYDSEEPIMINISREIFLSLEETISAWKKQSQEQQNKFISDEKEVEPLQFISHYIIRNETGYPIQIINQKNVLIKSIAHNQQIDYQLEVQNYDEENEQQFFVGFRMIHPKYKYKSVKNISFNSQKEHEVVMQPIGKGINYNERDKIIIKPEIKNCKKVLMIKSSKYIYTYFDGFCQIKALPFDHDSYYRLPKEVHNELRVSLYEQKVTEYYRYMGKDGILRIMMKFLVYNYSPIPLQVCGKIVNPNEYVGISQKLNIQGISYKDSLLKVIKNEKQKQYYIFAESYIVDYYGLQFEFERQNKKILKMYSHKFKQNDLNYTVYLLPEAQFKFKVKSMNSQPVSLKTTIGKISFIIEDKKALCPFTVNSYLSPLQNSHINQFKRVIEITPQYMLSNATKSLIKICQAESCDSISLNPYERMPFFWQNKIKPKFIKLSSYDGLDFWGYSGNLTIQKSTQTIVLRKSSDPTMYRIFAIQIQITNTVTFIHVIEPSPKYFISNKIPGTVMQVYQMAIMDEKIDHQCSFPKQFVFNVKYGQDKPFGYELPLQSHKIAIFVELDYGREQFFDLVCDDNITMQDLQSNLDTRTIALRNKQRKIISKFNVILCFENNLKKLKLQIEEDEVETQNSYQYLIKIPQIGISFIGFYNQLRKEIMHLMFNVIQIEISGNADYSDFNLLISSCRIENQLKYNAIYPVVFQSLHTKQAKYFINFKITRSAKNSRLIHYIGCSINKSWLTITSEELQVLQQNINKINVNKQSSGPIRKCQLFNSNLPDPEESLYFVEAVIHPLRSNITFKHVNEWGGKLLKTFSSINQCPISAEGMKLKHFGCQNLSVFLGLLLKHYQEGISKMILPMIGNLTILGSPVTLVQKIGSGFKDLVQLPAEGFETSPLQGGKGVVRGAKSLLTNTFTGAFNTVESITGSISNGITLLVDDDNDFSKDREKIKNDRSEHVLGGLANGAKSIVNGFKNGITGLFTQPVRGAQKNGLPGFLFGAAKGVGGLVIKPISGVIDAASKTAEGIKNTPEFFNNQKQKRFIRIHNPRPFYNIYKQFRNYDRQLADLIKILQQQQKQKYSNLSLCGYYFLKTQKASSKPILILSYQYLFIYDISKQKLLQTIKSQNFMGVALDQSGFVKIKVKDSKNNREGYVTVDPDGGCRKLANQINTIVRHYSPNFKFD